MYFCYVICVYLRNTEFPRFLFVREFENFFSSRPSFLLVGGFAISKPTSWKNDHTPAFVTNT
jgi:hypothetical protein